MVRKHQQLLGCLSLLMFYFLRSLVLQGKSLTVVTSMQKAQQTTGTTGTSSSERDNDVDPLGEAMDQVVRLLFKNQTKAEEYIKQYPGRNFRFYVYDTLPKEWSYPYINECAFKTLMGKTNSSCDWGMSICTQKESSGSPYDTRRFNRNADAILAKIFSEYNGTLRTYRPEEARIFIVPYPASGHCACHNTVARCPNVKQQFIVDNIIRNLKYYNETTKLKHVFMSSSQGDINHPFMKSQQVLLTIEVDRTRCAIGKNCGQVAIPYANTNADYQPNKLSFTDTKKFSIGSAISRTKVFQGRGKKDLLKPQIRAQFLQEAVIRFNTSKELGNLPVQITGVYSEVKHENGEQEILQLYKNSIFCPILRGDTPAQKRFFDVLLSGCIPFVMEYQSDEHNYPSFWEPSTASVRLVYPFAQGTFHGIPEMGIDYHDIVVPINGTCGIHCVFPQLEHMIQQNQSRIAELQQNIRRLAPLFSYGMENNALKYPDAASGILVRLRHYVQYLES